MTAVSSPPVPEVGTEAPDFELRDQNRNPVRLSSFRGAKNVVVVFYPMAFTGVCTGELCAIRDQIADFSNETTQTLAISTDAAPSLKKYATEQGYAFPLLSDFWPHGGTARAYGVLDEASGLAVRGTFIVDRDGVLRYTVVNGIPDARDEVRYLEVLRSL